MVERYRKRSSGKSYHHQRRFFKIIPIVFLSSIICFLTAQFVLMKQLHTFGSKEQHADNEDHNDIVVKQDNEATIAISSVSMKKKKVSSVCTFPHLSCQQILDAFELSREHPNVINDGNYMNWTYLKSSMEGNTRFYVPVHPLDDFRLVLSKKQNLTTTQYNNALKVVSGIGRMEMSYKILHNRRVPGRVIHVASGTTKGKETFFFNSYDSLYPRALGHEVIIFESRSIHQLKMCMLLERNGWMKKRGGGGNNDSVHDDESGVSIYPYALGSNDGGVGEEGSSSSDVFYGDLFNANDGVGVGVGVTWKKDNLGSVTLNDGSCFHRRVAAAPGATTLDSLAKTNGWITDLRIPIYLLRIDDALFYPRVLEGANTILQSGRIENILISFIPQVEVEEGRSTAREDEVMGIMKLLMSTGYRLREIWKDSRSDDNNVPFSDLHPNLLVDVRKLVKEHLIVAEGGGGMEEANQKMELWWVKKGNFWFHETDFRESWTLHRYYYYSSSSDIAAAPAAAAVSDPPPCDRTCPAISCKRSNDGRKLLIAHYSGASGDLHERMLQISSVTGKAYAKRWSVDYLEMKGVAMGPTPAHACYNKIDIVQSAIDDVKLYDTLLLLDSDAIIVDLDLDFLDLIPKDRMLTAMSVKGGPVHTWNINNGVTLWNLRHFKTQEFLDEWRRLSWSEIQKGMGISDQNPLQEILRKKPSEERRGIMHALRTKHFSYEDGTAVKHFKRGKILDWTGYRHLERTKMLEIARNETCDKYAPLCENL